MLSRMIRVRTRKRSSTDFLVLGVPGWLVLGSLLVVVDVEALEAADSEKVTYDDHIVPLFRRRCFGCHNQDKKKGGLAVNTHTLLMEGGSSGAVLVPGDPDASRLYALVTHQEEPHMPPRRGRLPDEDLALIETWIRGGALENRQSKAKVAPKPKLNLVVQAPNSKPEGPPPMPRGLSMEPQVRTQRSTAVTALAASPWAPLLAVSGQRQVLLYHSESGELVGILPFPEGSAQILKFSRNGTLLLAGGGRAAHSGRVVVWEVTAGRRVIEVGDEVDSVLAADISADQRFVALGGPSKMLRVYATADGSLVHEIKKHTDWIQAIEFSPDGVLLASADRAGGLHVWESLTGREFLSLRGHSGAVTDVSWRADSNILASASEDRTVRLWEMNNGKQVKRWNAHGDGTLAVEFYRDGRLVTCGRDRQTTVWDQNGKRLRNCEKAGDLPLEVVFDHSGKKVISGDWAGELHLWGVEDGKRLVAFSSNPETIAEREAAANSAAEVLASKHAEVVRMHDSLTGARDEARSQLAKARDEERQLREKLQAADRELAQHRQKTAGEFEKLREALAQLDAQEETAKKAREVKEAEQAEASALVEATHKAVAASSQRLLAVIGERLAGHQASVSKAGAVATARKRIADLDSALQEKEKAMQDHAAVVAEAAAAWKQARAVVSKWQAARTLDQSLTALRTTEGELQLARVAVSEQETIVLELLQSLQAAVERASSAIQAAGRSVEEAAATAQRQTAELGKAGTQAATPGADDSFAKVEARAVALEKIAQQLTTTLDESVASLRETQSQAAAAVGVGEATRKEIAAQRERCEAAQSELTTRQTRLTEAQKRVDAARVVVESSIKAFEAAKEGAAVAVAVNN